MLSARVCGRPSDSFKGAGGRESLREREGVMRRQLRNTLALIVREVQLRTPGKEGKEGGAQSRRGAYPVSMERKPCHEVQDAMLRSPEKEGGARSRRGASLALMECKAGRKYRHKLQDAMLRPPEKEGGA